MMSSAWLRRPLSITAWVLIGGLTLVLSPVLLLAAAVAAALARERKPLVLARVLLAYLLRELLTLVACGALWLCSGAGTLMGTPTFQRWHWQLLRWIVHGVTDPAVRALDITVVEDASSQADRALSDGGPLVLFSRHAGPGDTMVLVDQLLSRFDRRPSVGSDRAACSSCIPRAATSAPRAGAAPSAACGRRATPRPATPPRC